MLLDRGGEELQASALAMSRVARCLQRVLLKEPPASARGRTHGVMGVLQVSFLDDLSLVR